MNNGPSSASDDGDELLEEPRISACVTSDVFVSLSAIVVSLALSLGDSMLDVTVCSLDINTVEDGCETPELCTFALVATFNCVVAGASGGGVAGGGRDGLLGIVVVDVVGHGGAVAVTSRLNRRSGERTDTNPNIGHPTDFQQVATC